MEEVRSGRLGFCKLDVLHRRNLELILPRFGVDRLSEDDRRALNLAWHRLDAWPDVAGGLRRLKNRYLLAPVSNGNISLMVDLARRNDFPWDAIWAPRSPAITSQTARLPRGGGKRSICHRLNARTPAIWRPQQRLACAQRRSAG